MGLIKRGSGGMKLGWSPIMGIVGLAIIWDRDLVDDQIVEPVAFWFFDEFGDRGATGGTDFDVVRQFPFAKGTVDHIGHPN
jgi:hypothetical protein